MDSLQGGITTWFIRLSGTIEVMTNQLSISHQRLTVSKAVILIFQAPGNIQWIDSCAIITLGKKRVQR